MKKLSIRIPDAGPFGETRRDARERAMVAASLVKRPSGGCVESVVTAALHFRLATGRVAASIAPAWRRSARAFALGFRSRLPRRGLPARCGLPARRGLLLRRGALPSRCRLLPMQPLGQVLPPGGPVPLLVLLVGDLAFHEEMRELSALRLAFE